MLFWNVRDKVDLVRFVNNELWVAHGKNLEKY